MVDTAPKKLKYSEAKLQAHKAHSKTRENLGLAFTRWGALKERMGMKGKWSGAHASGVVEPERTAQL